MLETIKNLPTMYLIIAAVFVVYGVGCVLYMLKSKKQKTSFFDQNPNASSVTCHYGRKGIKSVAVELLSVDDAPPKNFFQTGISLVYGFLPGTYVFEVQGTTSRPGVMYKSVNYTYGPIKIEVTIEARKKYVLDFDPKTEAFTFNEEGSL